MKSTKDGREQCSRCMDKIELDPDNFRLGLTKVFFRAGVLGDMEEKRDERLNKIVSQIQAVIRGYMGLKEYQKLQDQRAALVIVQRAVRNYMKLQGWPWFRLWVKLRPMLYETRIEDELKRLEEEAAEATSKLEGEQKGRKAAEDANIKLLEEKNALVSRLESERGSMGDELAKQQKLQAQKADLEAQLNDAQERLAAEETA